MKYFHLIWAMLFRRKTRTFLTLISIASAFLLFGLLDVVRTSFALVGQSSAGAERLQTSSSLSNHDGLPLSLQARIEMIPGVRAVGYANWFGGAYQDPRNLIFSFAVSPNYLDLYPEIQVDPDQLKAFAVTQSGALAGEGLAKRYGWKIGDKIPLQSSYFPNKDGGQNWNFELVGFLYSSDEKASAFYSNTFLLHWKMFDEATPYNRGDVGWYVTRVDNIKNSDRVAKAIDALSANSSHETSTQTEQATTASALKQVADIGLITNSIIGAVFFTLLLLTGNTMMQAVRERTSELAVLKTIGFNNGRTLGLVLFESTLLVVLGGMIGLMLTAMLLPGMNARSRGLLPSTLPLSVWVIGIVLMFGVGIVVGALPAWRALQLNIVNALARR